MNVTGSSQTHTTRSSPNFVILSLGQFVQNADIPCYALNQHWWKLFKMYLPRFPHTIRSVYCRSSDAPRDTEHKSTEYLVSRAELVNPYLYGHCHLLSRFKALRHVTIKFNLALLSDMTFTSVILNEILHSLTSLETIGFNWFESYTKGIIDDFILNMPRKLTSLDMNRMEFMPLFEIHFPQLIHFDAPYDIGAENFCCKMVNLRSLAWFGVPSSFDCFGFMSCLQRIRWVLPSLSLGQWNAFAMAAPRTLTTLQICSLTCNWSFEVVLSSPEAAKLPTVREFIYESQACPQTHFDQVKRLMPQVKHCSVHFGFFVAGATSSARLFVEQAIAADLDSATVKFTNYDCQATCITYHRGDSNIYPY